MTSNTRSFAIVTGASSGIGYELAKLCAENGFDLLVAADEPGINQAAQGFRAVGVNVEAVEADLATEQLEAGSVDLPDRHGRRRRR